MTTLRTAAFAAALLLSGAAMPPASATPVAHPDNFANADFSLSGGVDAAAAQLAVERYFDFDAVVTLGALALAGAAMAGFAAAAARRRAEETAEAAPAWRETVFRAVQADLAAFTDSYRRAA